MKKVFKIVGIIAASVLLLVICLLAYLKFAFDPNQFKTQIVNYVQEKKQRTLVIDGDIQLSVFPQLGVNLGKLSLSAHQSKEPFASLEKAHVSLALMPLLNKQLLVDQIQLDGAKILYTRDAKGASNIDDLLSADKDSSSEQMQFDVQGIIISNADITINDAQNALHAQAKNVQFTSGRLADKTPTDLTFSAQLISSKPQADVQLNFVSKLYFDLQAQELKLDQFNFSLKGVLENKKLESAIKAAAIQNNTTQQSFSVEGLDFKGQTQLGDDVVNISLIAPSLQLNKNNAVGKTITGDIKLMGKNNVKANFTLANVSGNANAIKLDKLSLDASSKQGEREITAQLASTLEINLSEQRIDMPRFTINAQLSDPSLAQKEIKLPINGELSVNLKTKTLRSNLQSQFDESNLKTTLTILGFEQPAFAFTTEIDQLNIDRYLGAPSKTKSSTNTNVAETPIDLSALKTINANGKISIGKLQFSNIKVSALQLPLRASKGKIELHDFSAQLYQGSIKGNINVDANNNTFTIQQSMNGISINPLMQDAISKDVVEGRGDVVMNVRTQGNTVSELKRGLDGKISLNLVDGAVKGINLAKSLREFKSKILGKSDQNQTANVTEKTDFSAMSASINFTKGIGQNDDLNLQSPFLRVGGAGNVNLQNDSVDYIAKVTVVNTATGQEGKDLAQLKDLSIPIRLHGPFDKIDYQLQFSQISSDALKAVFKEKAAPIIDEKKKEIEDKLKNKLKDKLNGLFK